MTAAPFRTHVLCVGGEDHYLRIPFLLELRRLGIQVTAAGTGNPAPFARAGLDYQPFYFERFLNPAEDRASIAQLEKILKDVAPGIVQSFDTKPNVLVPWAARSAPKVRVVRTINGMGWVYSSRSPVALALRPVQRYMHRRAGRMTDVTVFQNARDKAYFEENGLVPRGWSVLIPGSDVDVTGFDDALAHAPASARLRDELGLGNAPVVITVTRLTRQKGIPTLLKAAQQVHEVRPDIRFVLVGPRESEGRLAVTTRELERHASYVIATGPRNDVPALLRMANIFAFPTEYREGVPRALMEAALAGLPIVATDMPGCDDVVRDGWTGRLVPPGVPKKLAEGILDLLADPVKASDMGRLASLHVRQNFSLPLAAARYRDIYRDVLDPPHAVSSSQAGAMKRDAKPVSLTKHDLVLFDQT